MALDGRWNIDRLKSQVTGTIDPPTRDRFIQWCQNIGLLPHCKHCYKCGKVMNVVNTSAESSGANTCIGKMFRCQTRKNRTHDYKVPLVNKTLFEGHHLPIEKLLTTIYLFTNRSSYEDVRRETFDWLNNIEISDNTIANWYSYCRETCLCALDDSFE
jgi:hypothetical protein